MTLIVLELLFKKFSSSSKRDERVRKKVDAFQPFFLRKNHAERGVSRDDFNAVTESVSFVSCFPRTVTSFFLDLPM